MLTNKNCSKSKHVNFPCTLFTCLIDRLQLIIIQSVIGVVNALQNSKDRFVLENNYQQHKSFVLRIKECHCAPMAAKVLLVLEDIYIARAQFSSPNY